MKKQKEMLLPSPAGNDIHAILLEEVDRQCYTLKPERIEDKRVGNQRVCQRAGIAFAMSAFVTLAYVEKMHTVPPYHIQHITGSAFMIGTLSALVIAAIGVGIHYLHSKNVNRHFRTAVHNKQYIYSYAPTIGLFVIRFQYKNNLYRCCIRRDTQLPLRKERP